MDKKTKLFAHQDWSEDFFMPKKSTAKTSEKKIGDAMKSGGGLVVTKKGKLALYSCIDNTNNNNNIIIVSKCQ